VSTLLLSTNAWQTLVPAFVLLHRLSVGTVRWGNFFMQIYWSLPAVKRFSRLPKIHSIRSETNAVVRVNQSHSPSGFGPVLLSSARHTRSLSRRIPGKPLLDIGRQLGAQAALQVLDTQVLGSLIQTHQVGREVRGSLLPPSCCDVAAVATSDSDLMQHDRLVFSARETEYIILGSPEELNVLPKKDLIFIQLPVVARNVERQLDWITIFDVPPLALQRSLVRPGIRNC
jgi:hypothetical protein